MVRRKEEIKNTAKKFADALSDGLYYSSPQYKCREHGFIQGAQWADKTMIDKTWDWILRYFVCGCPLEYIKEMEKAFRKEMEE